MIRVRVPAGILAIVFGLLLLPSMASALKFEPGSGGSSAQVGSASDVQTGDFDGDGLDDLAVAGGTSPTSNGINILLADGGGDFTKSGTLACDHVSGCFSLAVGNFTGGDSDLDIFGFPFQSNSLLYTFVGNGAGGFTRLSMNSPVVPRGRNSIAVVDLNGNGVDDIVIGGAGGNYAIGIAQGPGTFSFTSGSIPAGDLYSATTGDFNNDNKNDVAFGDDGGKINVLLGDGGGNLSYTASADNPASTAGGLNFVDSMVSSDFNGDGRDDVGVTAGLTLGQPHETSVQTFLSNSAGNQVTNANAGGSIFSPIFDGETPNTFSDLVTADFDKNGTPGDLAYLSVRRPNGPTVYQSSIRLSSGDGAFTAAPDSPFIYNQPTHMWGQATGDFNGDGAPDLAGASPGGGSCFGCAAPVLMSFADVSTSPSPVDFGGVLTGTSSTATTLTINNTGAPTAHLSGFTIDGTDAGQFSVNNTNSCNSTVVAACTKQVTFSPTSDGAKSAVLHISNADGPNLTVDLSGSGTSPAIGFVPSSTDFGELALGLTSAPQTVTVISTGTAPLHINQLTEGAGDSGSFEIVGGSDTCSNASLVEFATCEFKAVFAPGFGAGSKALNIEVPNDSAGAQGTTLQGVATSPGLGIDPTSNTFSDAIIDGPGQGQQFTITSTGTTDLKDITKSVTGPDASDFSLTAGNCTGAFAPTQTCTFIGIFSPGPADHAVRQATFEIRSNAASSPKLVQVSGRATVPHLTAGPNPVDFSEAKVLDTSAVKTATFTSDGTGALIVDEVGVNGVNSDDFSIVSDTCAGAFLPVGQTCQVGLSFTPGAIGERTAEVRLTSDAGNFYVSTVGEGIDPSGSFTAALDLGQVTIGSTDTDPTGELVFTSLGETPAKVTGASITGANAADFSFVDANSCTGAFAPNEKCTLTVRFDPQAGTPGPRSASAVIETNTGTFTAGLTGTALKPINPGVSKLSLRLKAAKKVKRGKKLKVAATLRNIGTRDLEHLKIRTTVTKKLGKASKTSEVKDLFVGKSIRKSISVTLFKSAKPGRKVTVTVTITSGGRKLASARVKSKVTK